MSVLYRQWSRFRSLQLLEDLGSPLPPQVGGIACHLSSDMVMAWVSDILDDAFFSQNHKCGLILDLTKCFNLVPRKPFQNSWRNSVFLGNILSHINPFFPIFVDYWMLLAKLAMKNWAMAQSPLTICQGGNHTHCSEGGAAQRTFGIPLVKP